jgi:hypothetical protein
MFDFSVIEQDDPGCGSSYGKIIPDRDNGGLSKKFLEAFHLALFLIGRLRFPRKRQDKDDENQRENRQMDLFFHCFPP